MVVTSITTIRPTKCLYYDSYWHVSLCNDFARASYSLYSHFLFLIIYFLYCVYCNCTHVHDNYIYSYSTLFCIGPICFVLYSIPSGPFVYGSLCSTVFVVLPYVLCILSVYLWLILILNCRTLLGARTQHCTFKTCLIIVIKVPIIIIMQHCHSMKSGKSFYIHLPIKQLLSSMHACQVSSDSDYEYH